MASAPWSAADASATGSSTLAAFASAVGSQDPVHTSSEAARAAGYRDVIAPPTFAVTIAQKCDAVFVQDPEAGIDYSRVVHGEQQFIHHRPIRAGDRLVATTTIDAVRSVAGNDLLTTRVDLATEDGEAVCTATSSNTPDAVASALIASALRHSWAWSNAGQDTDGIATRSVSSATARGREPATALANAPETPESVMRSSSHRSASRCAQGRCEAIDNVFSSS